MAVGQNCIKLHRMLCTHNSQREIYAFYMGKVSADSLLMLWSSVGSDVGRLNLSPKRYTRCKDGVLLWDNTFNRFLYYLQMWL